MRAMVASVAVLALAACGSEVEPETVETVDEAPAEDAVEEEPVAELGSTYTELSECTLEASNDEEGGWVKKRCPGIAGYELIVTSADLRDSLTLVTPEGQEQELAFSQVIAEGAFSELGRTVEWRGPTPDEPEVLIARMDVADPTDPMAADTSYLAVVRLDAPACIVARVPPGPGQNVAARRFADRETLPDCLGDAREDETSAQE